MPKAAVLAAMFLWACILVSVPDLRAGQKELIEKKVKELIELNKIVVEKNVDLKKYDKQTVFIKARLQQVSDNEYNVKVEEVSVDGIKDDGRKDENAIVIKAKVSEKADRTFHLDLENVLPPEKKESGGKEKENTK